MNIDVTFTAMADPTRRAILMRLAKGEATVNQLCEPFALSQPAISKHLKVLERAGLISRGREGTSRPCRLEAAPMREAHEWLGAFHEFWEESFNALDGVLEELKKAENKKGKKT